MKIYLILLITLFYNSIVNAKSSIYDFSFGVNFQSLKVHQGVILYRDFQINPDLNFKIINNQWEFVGDSLNYSRYIIDDKFKFRSKIVKITDHPLFPKNKSINSRTYHRKDSIEWLNRLEYNFENYSTHYNGQLAIEFVHDLFTHHGNYFDLEAKIKLFKYKSFEPNFFALISMGDLKNNIYFYGPTANNFGTNNFELGINLLVPEEVDRYYSLLQIHYFEVINSRNLNALYARDNNHGIQTSFTIVKNFH